MFDTFDVYRIADPIFRVHTRLFKLQAAILRSSQQQLRAYKLGVVSQAAGFSALLLFLLTMMIDIFDLKWKSISFWVLLGLVALAVSAHFFDYLHLRTSEKEFNRLIAEAGGENVEKWADFACATASGYGSRLKMLDDMQDELNKHHDAHEIDDQKYQSRTKYFQVIRDYCLEEVAALKETNEQLLRNRKRTRSEYEAVNLFIDQATGRLNS